MRHFRIVATLSGVCLVGTLAAGCGHAPTSATFIAVAPTPTPEPGAILNPYGYPTPQVAVGVAPTPMPDVTLAGPTGLPDLLAAVSSKSHDPFLLKKFTCNVTVTNPASVPRTGKVTVTFLHSGEVENGSPSQTQNVAVKASGTATLTFTDNKWHLLSEDASVQVVTDPYTPAASVRPPVTSFKTAVAPLFTSACAGCHTPGGQGASNIAIFDATGKVNYTEVSGKISQILAATQAGEMPQGRTALTPAELAVLESWQAEGTPNN